MKFWRRQRADDHAPAARVERVAIAGAVAQAIAESSPRRGSGLIERPTVRVGIYAWALLGMVGVAVVLATAIGRLSLLAIPLVIALFPAAILTPLAERLKARGLPDALVGAMLVIGTLALVIGIITVLVPVVSNQIDDLSEAFRTGVSQLRDFLQRGPFGMDPVDLDEVIDQAREQVRNAEVLSSGAVSGVAGQAGRFLTGLVVFVISLFFYLKDGPAIAGWLRRLFAERFRDDASNVGSIVWNTIGSYFRGQMLVALIDAVGITIGLLVLGVPLAIPIGVLVLFGSLFPVIGALVSGSVAVLVALASNGAVDAVIVLAIVLGVQQLEGNVLQPIILGRATQLHPLAVVTALIAGGSLLGILGAFLAVPVAASAWQTIIYLRRSIAEPA